MMDISVPYYEDNSRVSNSAIGWFLNQGPAYFHAKLSGTIEDETTSAMSRGTAIHMYFLQPEEFKNHYLVWTSPKPKSKQQEDFCKALVDSVEIEPNKAILSAYKKAYRTNGKTDENILSEAEQLAKELKDYISYLRNPERELLSMYQYQQLKILEQSVNTHKLAKELLNPTKGEVHHEFHINWELHGVQCKSLLDSVHFDFESKVCTLMDIKTTTKINNFEDSINHYDYMRQLEFYTLALLWYLEHEREQDPSVWKFKWYIIAMDTNGSNRVRVFQFTDDQVLLKSVKILYAIDTIKWHMEHNLWEHSKEYYEGDGAETLNL